MNKISISRSFFKFFSWFQRLIVNCRIGQENIAYIADIFPMSQCFKSYSSS